MVHIFSNNFQTIFSNNFFKQFFSEFPVPVELGGDSAVSGRAHLPRDFRPHPHHLLRQHDQEAGRSGADFVETVPAVIYGQALKSADYKLVNFAFHDFIEYLLRTFHKIDFWS
jgi:hypothetical protein